MGLSSTNPLALDLDLYMAGFTSQIEYELHKVELTASEKKSQRANQMLQSKVEQRLALLLSPEDFMAMPEEPDA